MGVAAHAAPIGSHGFQHPVGISIALIIHSHPSAVERSRPEIIFAPIDHITRRITHRAVDALHVLAGHFAPRLVRLDEVEVIVPRAAAFKTASCQLLLLEKRRQISS